MPKEPTSSTVVGKLHDLSDAHPTTDGRIYCSVKGCGYSYKNATDASRHKWSHLPTMLLPNCPFVDEFGEQCSHKYIGRSSQVKKHWLREHQKIRPYPVDVRWPTLNDILALHRLNLGEKTPRVSLAPMFPPTTHHQPCPPAVSHATVPPFDMLGCIERMQNHMHWSLDQHSFPEQIQNANMFVDLTPHGHFQPQTISPALSNGTDVSEASQISLYPSLFAPFGNTIIPVEGPIQHIGGHFVPQVSVDTYTLSKPFETSTNYAQLPWDTYIHDE